MDRKVAGPDPVMPTSPGLHLLLDRPQGPGAGLALRHAASALADGQPVIALLFDQAAPQFQARLARHGVETTEAEETGRLAYVDAFSVRTGWAHTNPATVFVESPDPDTILMGLSEAQAGVVEIAPEHLILVDAFSTLLVLHGLPETYALCQSLTSLAPRLGAVTLGRMIEGMHSREHLTALLHLANTVTDVTDQPQTRTEAPGRQGSQR